MNEAQTVAIFYKPLADISKSFPDVAREVIIPAKWTDEEIEQWWIKRNTHIFHKGIKVYKIVHLDY